MDLRRLCLVALVRTIAYGVNVTFDDYMTVLQYICPYNTFCTRQSVKIGAQHTHKLRRKSDGGSYQAETRDYVHESLDVKPGCSVQGAQCSLFKTGY
ncbi:hypothetical protein DPMN_154133 [Dreissena polymorpha]|uniref:Secreted protein n=1 Tax=Dreissena polymorpha TaxID=45954 RepID=A0A9D4FKJ9_DREPO|nr:hypothetical protein DPMN_154103 [Dreissena polymorpha]KAH3800500.1 hypothetical protein DPMN_154133 [Dreissena polymorpha]